jgi:TetR/AcrR family transcriptional repressor of nem operon
LQKKIESILDYKKRYFESAIRDADAAGLIKARDPKAKAVVLFCYYQGLVTEARIRNDVEILRTAIPGTHELLGSKQSALAEVAS